MVRIVASLGSRSWIIGHGTAGDMSTAHVRITGVGTRRPRDRKAQILTAAAEQFGTLGYSNANLTEIADASESLQERCIGIFETKKRYSLS